MNERIPRSLEELPDPLTVKETAEVLRVGPTLVYKLLLDGKLRYLPVGTKRPRKLIWKADLLAYIEASKVGGR